MNKVKVLEQKTFNLRTVPNPLVYDKFPKPLLRHDSDFVDQYNELIFTTQKTILNLTLAHLTKYTKKVESKLIEVKKSILLFDL